MKQRETWRVITGTVALILVVAGLLSTPSMIFAKTVSVVDTELREQSPHAARVLTQYDLGDNASLQKLPEKLGNWSLTHTYDWDSVATLLSANTMLSRDYERADLAQPVNLLIVQSRNVSTFHPAPVCYVAQGWTVPDDGQIVSVPVPNASWSQAQWLSKGEPYVFQGEMTAKALDVTKGIGTKNATEHVALYVYLKREDWQITNDITWLRFEIDVPPGTGADAVLPILSDLFAQTVPHIFAFDAGHEQNLAESLVTRAGAAGYAVMAIGVAVPAGVIVSGMRTRRDRS